MSNVRNEPVERALAKVNQRLRNAGRMHLTGQDYNLAWAALVEFLAEEDARTPRQELGVEAAGQLVRHVKAELLAMEPVDSELGAWLCDVPTNTTAAMDRRLIEAIAAKPLKP